MDDKLYDLFYRLSDDFLRRESVIRESRNWRDAGFASSFDYQRQMMVVALERALYDPWVETWDEAVETTVSNCAKTSAEMRRCNSDL